MNTKVTSMVFLLLAMCWPLYGAETEPAAKPQILNVVLIELDTSPGSKLTRPILNDWDYWNKCAGKLIRSLEARLGHTRAAGGVKESDATLFAIRAAAKGLDDGESLGPVIRILERICQITRKPSFLIVWLKQEGSILAAIHDLGEMKPSIAFVMLKNVLEAHTVPGGLPGSYVPPPCLVCRTIPRDRIGPKLDDFCLESAANMRLFLCLSGAEAQVILGAALKSIRKSSPVGAAMEAWRDPVARAQILDSVGMGVESSLDMTSGFIHDKIGENFGRSFDASFGPGADGRFFASELVKPSTWDIGGILLEPELTVVVDQSGLTTALASKAIAAVKGKTAGGEFMDEGKKYIAVKTPGTAQMFQVPAGKFHVTHTDIVVKTKDSTVLRLERFYDSSWSKVSVLGQGWSLQPFSLKFDQRVESEDGKTFVALKPVLIDRQVGARLPYRLMKADSSTSQTVQKATIAKYQKVSSSLQPYLVAQNDGGYRATFAHGFQIDFDSNGRMEWMGNSAADRVEYVFSSDRLKEVRSAGGKIALLYDEKNCLTSAKSSNGQVVRYILGSSGRLDSVAGLESGPFKFTYGADGRLSTVSQIKDKQKPDLLFTNTYDAKGRMLTHRTPQGQWRFAYDDDIGRVIVNEPAGKQTSYYYDAHQRLIACGSSKDEMTLFNYDITGRILQVAMAELLNDPSKSERPKFKVSEKVFPLPSAKGKEEG